MVFVSWWFPICFLMFNSLESWWRCSISPVLPSKLSTVFTEVKPKYTERIYDRKGIMFFQTIKWVLPAASFLGVCSQNHHFELSGKSLCMLARFPNEAPRPVMVKNPDGSITQHYMPSVQYQVGETSCGKDKFHGPQKTRLFLGVMIKYNP